MGMYDTITVWPRDRTHCADGHALGDLQTKSLECLMHRYVVFDGALYRVVEDDRETVVAAEGGRPVMRRTSRMEEERRTTTVLAYNHCGSCRPVLYLGGRSAWADEVSERDPWAEWQLELVDGRLVDLVPVKLETRDDIRAALRKEGLEVLDDDERLARLHFARRSEPEAR